MIQSEYQRFLQTLNSNEVSSEVRKLANLVLTNLEVLIPLGSHQGQRVKRIAALAQANWDVLSAEIQPIPNQAAEQTRSTYQLKRMTVGPFRGFAKQEVFDLSSRLVLIYGPNGTGKSSFCEALEYGLLGNVAEAESKRFRDQRDYLKNAYVNSFLAPTILGMSGQGDEMVVEANESLYRFCFVEKNRIDSFSRIAAQPPAKQTELISTLFGLDSFNEFVRNFTMEIDPKYIDLTGVKAAQLLQKRQTLTGAQQQIDANKTELQKIGVDEQVLANRYREGTTFSQLISELNGNDQSPGVIQKLEIELNQPLANKSNLTIATLHALVNSINTWLKELTIKQQELTQNSQQVSFRQLYDAVIQVQPNSQNHCPACKTPLSEAALNPYTYATEELQKLQHLAVLQQTIQQHQHNLGQGLMELWQILATCLRFFPQNNVLLNYQLPPGTQANIECWNALHQQLQDNCTALQHLEAQVKYLENSDKEIDQATQIRLSKQAELNHLREFATQILVLQTRRKTAEQSIAVAQQTISKFNIENAQLIVDVDVEKSVVAKNQVIAAAYKSFVERLNLYKDRLPSQLVANLGDLVVTLYNAFNRYDAEEDKLASVQLPLTQNQRLNIAFKKDPSTRFDALHVLSEGHIRCIGLAILLAKNIKERCSILIFDDPVNAIDDEHRRAIRETLFVDEFFSNCQIILAIHGEEFFNNTHQLLGKRRAQAAESYLFLPGTGDHHIQVNSLKRPKNYVLAARELYDQGEYRDALMSSRRALESLCDRTWSHYGNYSDKKDALISVSRRSPAAPWDLRTLAENLSSKLKCSKAEIPNKQEIVEALTTVLGADGKNTYWAYLNKGTHEETDLPEFDQYTVNEVIAALERLDSALNITK